MRSLEIVDNFPANYNPNPIYKRKSTNLDKKDSNISSQSESATNDNNNNNLQETPSGKNS